MLEKEEVNISMLTWEKLLIQNPKYKTSYGKFNSERKVAQKIIGKFGLSLQNKPGETN